jgi:hypothetical protein
LWVTSKISCTRPDNAQGCFYRFSAMVVCKELRTPDERQL